jgi:hypothetical protein
MRGKTLLIIAAGASFGVCVLHLAAILIGPAAYRLLGAGEDFAAMAEIGSPFPALITFGLAVLFAIFGFYALSGAGVLRRFPLLAVVLVGTTALYTLRGALLFVELGLSLASLVPLDGMNILYSAASLAIGIIHFTGLKTNWQQIR